MSLCLFPDTSILCIQVRKTGETAFPAADGTYFTLLQVRKERPMTAEYPNKPVSVDVLDTTLRDGAQAEGISFSVNDKFAVFEALADIGVKYVEAGNPGSNPKDREFFSTFIQTKDAGTRLCAFGSTKRKDKTCDEDAQIQSLLQSGTSTIVIFGKVWAMEVEEIIRATPDENIRMIADTISYFAVRGKEVVFDAEHYFEAAKSNREYAKACLLAAQNAGASCVCLCDTNGSTMPEDVAEYTAEVVALVDPDRCKVGIHCHNDSGVAVSNTLQAVLAGARHIQGTFNGIGERCGNANLATIIPNLQLKYGIRCVPEDRMDLLTPIARKIADIENMTLPGSAPYVGISAFAHKAGMHVDAIKKNTSTFEHVPPESVGNSRRFLVSEIAGKAAILELIRRIRPDIDKASPEVEQVLARVKQLEHDGYSFEGAEASQELLVCRELGIYRPFFDLERIAVNSEHPHIGPLSASSFIKIHVDGKTEVTAEEGDGPINAIDKALRKAMEVFYPELKKTRLSDYKVRVLNRHATASSVRVLIETTDGIRSWRTVGVSTDIISASYQALVDSLEYPLMTARLKKS